MALAQLWQVVEEACVLIGARAQGLQEGGGIFVKSTIGWINLGWIFSSLFDHVPRTIYRFNRSTYGFFLLAAQNLTKVAKYDFLQQFRQILWKVHENRQRSIHCLWVGIATRHERQHSKSGNSTKLIWVRPLNVNNTNRWCTGCPLPLMHILVLNALGEKKLSVPMTSDILFRMCTSLHGLSTWMTFLKSPAKHDRLSCTIRASCWGGGFIKKITIAIRFETAAEIWILPSKCWYQSSYFCPLCLLYISKWRNCFPAFYKMSNVGLIGLPC